MDIGYYQMEIKKFKMNIKVLSFVFYALMSVGCGSTSSQNANNISNIKDYVELINGKYLKDTSFAFDGKYMETDAITVVNIGSSELTAYIDGNSLVKIKVIYNGSHGDMTTTIFCKDGKCVFIEKILEIYEPPKHEENSKIKTTIRNKFYLSNDKIIYFENEGGIIRYNQPNKLNLEMKFKELHQDYKNYRKLLESSFE